MKKLFVPIIIIACFIVYFNTFFNDFVWDDHFFILDNYEIRSFSNIPSFFTKSVDDTYRPLRSVNYMIIYSIFKQNPIGYHLNSILFHTLISLLVYFIILKIMSKPNIAFFSALLFAIHPIHTGRVTNMTAGFDLLGIFLYLLSFYFYLIFSKNKKKKFFLYSILIFVVGLFASEEVATLPLIIVLYELVINKRKIFDKKYFYRRYLAYFVFLVGYLILRFFVLGIVGRNTEFESSGIFFTLITMSKIFVMYIIKLIIPLNLKLFYDIPVVDSLFRLDIIMYFVILFAIIFILFKIKNKFVKFFGFWFFITLIPFSNIIPLVVLMAERYLYLPSLGFCFILGYLLNFLIVHKKKTMKYFGIIIFVFLIIFYSVVAVDRNSEWRDNLTLWSETVKDSPNNSRAHDNLGFTYEQMGEYENAIKEFDRAIELKRDNYKAYVNLGVTFAKLKRYNESIEIIKESLRINDANYKAYNKLGLIYSEIDEYELSLKSHLISLEINPKYPKAYNDIGTVYATIGEFDLALNAFNQALTLDRTYADAHFNLGVLYDFLGEKDKALQEISIAVSLDPENEVFKNKYDSLKG